ncbi:MAG: hypothetical protein KBG34_01490, partial [Pseudoxanthomonas sp.]|nr:hypothetical protein [Pseudoxanthomonas sp.]MBP9535202.1 hypothetical protein [Pseudoxanthomonas sp.]
MYRSDESPLQRRPSRCGAPRFGGHFLLPPRVGIDEATGIQVAKDAVVRGSGASRPWMACARLLEPGTAESGDAPDPRTATAPPEANELRRFSTCPDPASLTGEKPQKALASGSEQLAGLACR